MQEDGPGRDREVRRVRAEVAARLRQPPAGSGRGQVHQGGDHCHGLVPYRYLTHIYVFRFQLLHKDVRIDGLRLVFHLLGQGQYTRYVDMKLGYRLRCHNGQVVWLA